MLEFKHLSLQIDNKNILNDITFKIANGNITALIGSNGCGKSTLVKQLLTNNQRIQLNGATYRKTSEVALLMQSTYIPDHFRVKDLLKFNLLATTSLLKRLTDQDLKQIDNCLAKCDCLDFKNSYFKHLSGGEKQRVMIAASIINNPKYLILDEPTTYLDIKYQTQVLKLLKQLNIESGITMLIVLHDINQALKLADQVICLKAGCVLFDKLPAEVTSDDLSNAFDINFKQHGNLVFTTSIN